MPNDIVDHTDGLLPSRSASALSLCSQSTQYTDIYGEDDITTMIAEVPWVDDSIYDDQDITMTVDETNAPIEPRESKKRRRDYEDGNTDERPNKCLNSTQESDRSTKTVIDEAGLKRTDTGSTAVAATPPTKTKSACGTSADTSARCAGVTLGSFSTASGSISTSSSASESPAQIDEEEPPVATLVPQAESASVEVFKPPKPIIIAHSRNLMAWLERLPWGVRWEISRYVNNIRGFGVDKFKIDDLKELCKLGKNAAAAPHVTQIVERLKPKKVDDSSDDEFAEAYSREKSARSPWEELDREDEVFCTHEHGALGCNDDDAVYEDDPGWYGGKVHFTVKVVISKETGQFGFVLDHPALGSSNRFMRRRGSQRFIRARIQKDALKRKGDQLSDFFRRPLVINGAVFRAFFAKEQNVFYVRTNECVQGHGQDLRIVQSQSSEQKKEWSLLRFLRWHNDLELNNDQTMSKWAARFALGLSNSVPGIRIKTENIRFEDDIICPAFKPDPHATKKPKPPSEMQMTDGCGFANRAVMQLLYDRFPWFIQPTAVQCRIGGAKGLLLVRHDLPPEDEVEPTVWLRPSQVKIKYTPDELKDRILPADADPALCILDILRTSRLRCPAKLSTETITNLAENGVPFTSFAELMRVDIDKRVSALLDWGESDDPSKRNSEMKLLWDALAKEGGIMSARLSREDCGRARASGYVVEDQEDDEWDDEDGLTQLDKSLREQSSAWWEDLVSGCPSSLEETCMTLLDSGFRPESCNVLRAKLREVARKAVRTFDTRYRFAVPMSCSAFIVPDPYGVLLPGEIHVKSSQRNLPDQQGRLTDIVKGDVLVTRHPCKVPSDVQKVRAVEHLKLSHYVDVIVVSTASHEHEGKSLDRHLASLTGGGDYDGDTMEVFWDPTIVKHFQSPDPERFAKEPPDVQNCLLKNAETVKDFNSSVSQDTTEYFKIYSLQKYLLGALQDRSLVGQYSTWWENSTYHNGYRHPDTIFLAYMFCAILDGSKTGVTVRPDKYREHCSNRIWQSRSPRWKETLEAEEQLDTTNKKHLTRHASLPPFVMDYLRFKIIKEKCSEACVQIDKKLKTDVPTEDTDLSHPWKDACERAAQLTKLGTDHMQDELSEIKKHVEHMYKEERAQLNSAAAAAGSKHAQKGKVAFTDLRIETRQDILRSLSKKFHSKPAGLLCFDAPEARRVKASYAYIYDRTSSKKVWTRFPWNVAMRALCEIKADAIGFPKTVAYDFYHFMRIDKAYLRKHGEESAW
ncbi:RNA dependent RNA polymerase-domain-containing protein [Daedaleopsis nitida]|nr:RNA dependent RNA polymerase-domain-containing protein [Daedaleopsis nitida]